jgi:sulfofructose kinase
MTRLACVGHSTIDAIFHVPVIPSTPTKVLASAYVEAGGGMAANASVAASRLGGNVEYWGRVGDDALGGRIVALLEAEGVRTAAVRRVVGARSPITAVLVDAGGERLICTYNDPALDDDASWLPVDSLVNVDVVLADVRWPAGAARAFAAARAAHVKTILDGDVAPAGTLRQLCNRCDYAIFSQLGLSLASGTASAGEGLRKMQRITGGMVGVTLGAEGFLWLERERELRARPPPVVAVDTLAAGDVFHGAFALAIGEHRSVADAAAFANAAAALKCTRPGGRLGAPMRAEVDALLRGNHDDLRGVSER